MPEDMFLAMMRRTADPWRPISLVNPGHHAGYSGAGCIPSTSGRL
jgi:hypothetical protein